MAHLVTLIPGDGIGPEVSDATHRVLDATGVEIEWVVEDAGAEVLEREGTTLPERVLEQIRRSRVAGVSASSTRRTTSFRRDGAVLSKAATSPAFVSAFFNRGLS